MDHGLEGFLHAIPAIVAIHGEIAPADSGDFDIAVQRAFEPFQIAAGGFGQYVAPVGNGVQRHGHAGIGNDARGGENVIEMPVHPTIRDHPHQMRRAAGGFQTCNEILQRFVFAETSVFYRKVDLAQIHRHHAARADIGMAHLGIAHLPRG